MVLQETNRAYLGQDQLFNKEMLKSATSLEFLDLEKLDQEDGQEFQACLGHTVNLRLL